MRKFTLFLITAFLAFGYNGWGQIFITELADPGNSAGSRFVELYNAGASDVDLSTGYDLQRWTNNYADPQDPVELTGTITAGGFYVVCANQTTFTATFGFAADQNIGTGGPADSNGDDQIALRNPSNTIIDMFGVVGEDGSNTCHEFEDGRAERIASVVAGNLTWDESEWNVWSDGSTASGCTNHISNDPQDAPDDFDPGAWIGAPTSDPTITVSLSSLTGFSYLVGNGPSAEQSFTIEGSDLTHDITLIPPTNYEISTGTGGSFSATNPITLTQSGGTVATTTIYTRLKAGLAGGNYNNEDITAASTDATSKTVTCSGSVIKAEPTNHVTSFAATANGSSEIDLSWTANDGAVVPDGYLIKASTSDNVSAPVDGTAVADNTTIGSNSGAINITHGTNAYEWAGLTAETEYHFKIYPYTNSGSNINFKTSATVPSVNATTEEAIAPSAGIVFISEVCDAVTDYNSEFLELYNNSNNIISLSNTKIIRYPGVGGESEYVWDFSTDGSGDTQIPANGIILITRGATKAEFVSEWGSIPSGVNYNEGNSLLYFGGGRRWAIKDGGTANTDDGTEIDATNQAVANGNGDYQYPTGTWNAETEGNATPGVVSSTQDPAAYLWDGGAATTNWNDADNWNPNQLPGSGTNVTIEAGKVSIEIASDQTADCYDLKVDGTLTIKSDASNTGSLIVNGTLSGSGTTTMERTIDEYTNNANGWHLLSSPINNLTISGSDFEPGTGTPNLDDFYGWDELTFFWLNQKVVANNITNFVNGVGYLVSYETLATKDFTGTFNNADVTFTNLSKTTNKGEGWHLLGNPFQSALQWTNTDWVRTNFGVGAKIMNPGGSYTDITVGGTDIIPANQGFFVEATVDNSNTITIPESQRVHSITPFYKNSVPNMLSLKAVDGDFYQKSCIQFMDGSSNNYDEDYDVHFLGGMSGTPQFYSFIEEDNLSTNRIPTPENETIVPMIFSTSGETTVSIEAEGVESFAPSFEILLEDLQENIIIDLLENPIYTFESNPEYDAERFRVHFKSTTGISEGENISSFNIYSFNKNIYVSNPEFQNANVFVYNLIGQEVATFKINGDATNSFQLGVPSGYYLVKVVGDQTINTKKVYLK